MALIAVSTRLLSKKNNSNPHGLIRDQTFINFVPKIYEMYTMESTNFEGKEGFIARRDKLSLWDKVMNGKLLIQ